MQGRARGRQRWGGGMLRVCPLPFFQTHARVSFIRNTNGCCFESMRVLSFRKGYKIFTKSVINKSVSFLILACVCWLLSALWPPARSCSHGSSSTLVQGLHSDFVATTSCCSYFVKSWNTITF